MTPRRLHPLLLALGLLALAGCRAPQPLVVDDVTPAPAQARPFLAGVATAPFTPAKGYPLGGYGGGARRAEFPLWLGLGWPGRLALAAHAWWHAEGQERRADMLVESEGTHDELTARALVLRPRDAPPLALVRIDAIGVTAELQAATAAAVADLGYRPSTVILSATHTHSGVACFMRAPFAALVAMDNFRAEVEARIVAACAAAIREAHEGARPAALGFARARDRGPEGQTVVARNRRFRRFRDEIEGDAIDDIIELLVVREAARGEAPGAPLALLLNYAVHPTVLGPDNLYYSQDLAGAIEREVEAVFGAPVLFFNGAEGDVGPGRLEHGGGLLRCRDLGRAMAGHVGPALEGVTLHEQVQLSAALGSKPMGWARTQVALGRARFVETDGDAGNLLLAPLALPVNLVLWSLGLTNLALVPSWNLGLGVVVDLDGLIDRHVTPVSAVRLRAGEEDVYLLGLPGEPTHDVGLELKDRAARRGASRAFVLGLCQDHIGYIASPAEYRRGGYEAWSTLFGVDTAPELLRAQERLLDALGAPPPRDP